MASHELMPLIVAVFAALALGAVVYALMDPFVSGDRQKEKRVSGVTESRAKKVAARSAAQSAADRRKAVADTLKDLDDRQKQKEKVTLRLRLEQAGLDVSPKSFWLASLLCGAVCGGGIMSSFPPTPLVMLSAIAGAFVATFGLPRWFLTKLIKRRQSKFLAELANAIDVVVRGVKSGLPLNECLNIISRESPEPIASEFKEVVEQQRVGVTLSDALERLTQRMPLPEVKFLTIVIAIQQQAGGNLSEALGNLSGVLRDRIRMQMKVKALSAEAKASAMVLASLPPGVMTMVYLASPDYIAPLFTTKTGHFFIFLGCFWMMCGVLVMRKMINFKY